MTVFQGAGPQSECEGLYPKPLEHVWLPAKLPFGNPASRLIIKPDTPTLTRNP